MKEIKTVGIVGFGVMGAAIGINAAMSGYRVVFKELNDELVQTMFDKWVVKSLEQRVAKGKITQADMDAITGMISGTSRYEALSDCDLIIEAAIEKMDLKIKSLSWFRGKPLVRLGFSIHSTALAAITKN